MIFIRITAVILFIAVLFAPAVTAAGSENYLPYDQLLVKTSEGNREIFKGKSFPVRIFSRNGEKVVMLTNESGAEQVFMIIPDSMINFFSNKINANKELEYSYKPMQMFNKYPLLQLIEVISE